MQHEANQKVVAKEVVYIIVIVIIILITYNYNYYEIVDDRDNNNICHCVAHSTKTRLRNDATLLSHIIRLSY
jgi:hypothetical protein